MSGKRVAIHIPFIFERYRRSQNAQTLAVLSGVSHLRRSSTARADSSLSVSAYPKNDLFATDERWQLARRVAASPGFASSPLMSRFLLYVVFESLAGRSAAISEHQIGIAVFGRHRGYRTDDDNIVRNYARQLRRRLAEYFAANIQTEILIIQMPIGGYVPLFTNTRHNDPISDTPQLIRSNDLSCQTPEQALQNSAFAAAAAQQPVAAAASFIPVETPLNTSQAPLIRRRLRALFSASQALISRRGSHQSLALIAYTIFVVFLSWRVAMHFSRQHTQANNITTPAHPLWVQIFNPARNTSVIPPDAGFNLVEDISDSTIPLADYMQGAYLNATLPQINPQSTRDLRTQQFTDFISARILAEIERLPEFSVQHTSILFPRDVRLDVLNNDNVILIGSMLSNPWSSLADPNGNFRFVPSAGMRGARIVNLKPKPGEATTYSSHWDQLAHDTFSILALTPNLSGSGYILLIEGLDVAGTQSAADFLLHSAAIQPILARAMRPDGSIRPFEILLRATSLQSHANGTTVIATRFYPDA